MLSLSLSLLLWPFYMCNFYLFGGDIIVALNDGFMKRVLLIELAT